MTRRPTAYVEEYERLVRSEPKRASESALDYVRRIAALAGDDVPVVEGPVGYPLRSEQEMPPPPEREPGADDE